MAALRRVASRIFTIMDDVLNITGSKELKLEAINLREFLDQIADLPEISQRTKNITLTVSGDCAPIEGAPKELREAFLCFLHNAIEAINEAGNEHGKISVEIREEPGEAHITISDNGCGIPAGKIHQIFRPTFTTKKDGSGFGLSVSQKIIQDRHGGAISVTSAIGDGSSFRIVLPNKPPRLSAPSQPKDISAKITDLRQAIAAAAQQDSKWGTISPSLVEQCISSMTMSHIQRTSIDQLRDQILGQLYRLEEFLITGEPHLSINNLSEGTEIVLAADKDSSSKDYWLDLIRYELGKAVNGNILDTNVTATRNIEKQAGDQRAVCRIFEISKYKGVKFTPDEDSKARNGPERKIDPPPLSCGPRTAEPFHGRVICGAPAAAGTGKHSQPDLQPFRAKPGHSPTGRVPDKIFSARAVVRRTDRPALSSGKTDADRDPEKFDRQPGGQSGNFSHLRQRYARFF